MEAGSPRSVGGEANDADVVEAFDASVSRHVGAPPLGLVPGAVVLVGHRGEVVVHRAYGHAQIHFDGGEQQQPRPMLPDTIFDVASLTKVCVTTTALMRLVADGLIALDDRVAAFLPEFQDQDKAAIRLRDLLTHRAGLWEWWPLYIEASGRDEAVRSAAALPLRYRIGEGRHYSDLSMILAGAVVEIVTGERLDDYVGRAIFEPLDLRDTGFLPGADRRALCAATSMGDAYEQRMLATGNPYPTGRRPNDFDRWRTHTLVGEANDGNAHHALRGVAGHAGLFSNARDVARFGQMLLGRGAASDGPQKTGGAASDGPQKTGGAASDGPQKTGGAASDGPQKTGGAASDGPQKTGGAASDGPQKTGGAASDGPQEEGGAASDGGRILPEEVVVEFTSEGVDAHQGLGFWTNRWAEAGLGGGGFGHQGFTGTQLLVDPAMELVVVLLTNRTHRPLPYPSIMPLWRDVLATAADIVRG